MTAVLNEMVSRMGGLSSWLIGSLTAMALGVTIATPGKLPIAYGIPVATIMTTGNANASTARIEINAAITTGYSLNISGFDSNLCQYGITHGDRRTGQNQTYRH